MKLARHLAVAVAVLAAGAGCNKPDDEACRKALENMRKLMGTSGQSADLTPAIRRCRGGSSKEAVACATKATSRAELEQCGFAHFDEAKPASGSGSGSASGN